MRETQPLFHKFVLLGLVGLLVLAVGLLAVWSAIAGPVTVMRIVRYGDTQIDDFTHDPGREIAPGASPLVLERADPELQLPPDALPGGESTLDEVLQERDSLAFLVLHDERIIIERYYQGHSPESISQMFSVTKSVTSALVGTAIADGVFEGVDQPITDFIPELAERGFEEVTIHHLLTMTSGSSYVENDNPFGEHVILDYTPQLEGRILRFEMESEPGTVFRYKSGDNALLGLALARALGEETISEYTQRRLWAPAGMQDPALWTLDREGDGLERTWCCLAGSGRDLVKFGLVYLNGGSLNGRRILPAEWVERSTRIGQVPERLWPRDYRSIGWRGYGYQWWLASETDMDFFALGKDGQFVYVNPADEVVIVRLGWSQGGLRASEWVALFQTISGEARRSGQGAGRRPVLAQTQDVGTAPRGGRMKVGQH